MLPPNQILIGQTITRKLHNPPPKKKSAHFFFYNPQISQVIF